MKKTLFAAVIVTAITFSSCSENGTANVEHAEHHEEMHDDAAHPAEPHHQEMHDDTAHAAAPHHQEVVH